jgi:ABC-type amino acid transport substrate-binding protein
MSMIKFSASLLTVIFLIGLLAAQCQSTPVPGPTPLTPPVTPTARLWPAIARGDGSDLLDKMLDSGVIRVGVRVWPGAEFSPPVFRGFSNAKTGGALNGFEVDVARQVADGLGLELELVEAYPPVIASGDWQGEWDIALALLTPFDRTPDKITFSQPYGYLPLAALVPISSTLQTFNDLSNKKVGVLEHSVYQRLLSNEGTALTVAGQSLLPTLPTRMQVAPVSNLSKAIHQLGEPGGGQETPVEAIFGPAPILQEAVKSGLPVRVAPQAQVGVQPLAVAIVSLDNLKTARLLAEINKILARLQREGTLAEIYLRWYGQDFSQNR